MANIKRFFAESATGLTVYVIVWREADSYLLNDADGAFANAPADPYIAMTEHGTIKGMYELNESRTAWNDGRYRITAYKQSGGSPAPVSDTIIAGGEFSISGDTIVTDGTIKADTGAVKTQTDKLQFDGSNRVKSTHEYITGAVVSDPGNGSIQFKTNLSYADDALKGGWLAFTSGQNATLPPKRISSNVNSTGYVYLSSAFPYTPAAGDAFKIINE